MDKILDVARWRQNYDMQRSRSNDQLSAKNLIVFIFHGNVWIDSNMDVFMKVKF